LEKVEKKPTSKKNPFKLTQRGRKTHLQEGRKKTIGGEKRRGLKTKKKNLEEERGSKTEGKESVQ